ncbi:Ribonuclease P protein subunit p30 [Blattella germanica]|nr:Ribonuclease P protein subunit p30 [Blattella germanica]
MITVRGFCDVNIRVEGDNLSTLRKTCNTLIDYGYQTIALNTCCEGSIFESKKKKKKGEPQDRPTDPIPEPGYADLVKEFEGSLKIYQRLTVSIANQLEAHKLSQSPNAKKYNILAIHACSSMDIDIISFDPDHIGSVKCARKMYNLAVNRGICFEIMYTPAIRDSSIRKNIIQMAHTYHTYGKSRNIIISSGATNPLHVRGPYDIINLSLLFGLSEEQAKGAITTTCRQLLLKAAGRRLGKTVIIASRNQNTIGKNSGDLDIENMDIDESELPAQKRLKQE